MASDSEWDEGRRVVREPPPQCIVLSDPGQDLDDEVAFLMMGALHVRGEIDLRAVVCTLEPAADRARLARGVLNAMGLQSVLVGVGNDGNAKGPGKMFLQHPRISPDPVNSTGKDILQRVYSEAADGSLSFFILASYSTAADFAKGHASLFIAKTKCVVIQGGAVEAPPLTNDTANDEANADANAKGSASTAAACKHLRLIPDDAHNNTMDKEASRYIMDFCQDSHIPMVMLTRHAASACALERHFYDDLAETGSPIGEHMQRAQEAAIQELFERAAAAPDSAERKGLPERCDGKWFRKTFCGNEDPLLMHKERGSCWQAVKSLNLYDPVAVLSGLPGPSDLFNFTKHVVDGTTHLLAGVSAEDPGVDDPGQVAMFVRMLALEGLNVTMRLEECKQDAAVASDLRSADSDGWHKIVIQWICDCFCFKRCRRRPAEADLPAGREKEAEAQTIELKRFEVSAGSKENALPEPEGGGREPVKPPSFFL